MVPRVARLSPSDGVPGFCCRGTPSALGLK